MNPVRLGRWGGAVPGKVAVLLGYFGQERSVVFVGSNAGGPTLAVPHVQKHGPTRHAGALCLLPSRLAKLLGAHRSPAPDLCWFSVGQSRFLGGWWLLLQRTSSAAIYLCLYMYICVFMYICIYVQEYVAYLQI